MVDLTLIFPGVNSLEGGRDLHSVLPKNKSLYTYIVISVMILLMLLILYVFLDYCHSQKKLLLSNRPKGKFYTKKIGLEGI